MKNYFNFQIMKRIALDIETTGLDPNQGHKDS